VPDDVRSAWTLLLEGDRKNLPALLAQAADDGPIELFHYDSDKTYAGRQFAMRTVAPQLAADAYVVMDDIQDNLFFRDWTEEHGLVPAVLGVGSYFVGATGVPLPD
jgi:hypothetical protein